jgi:hypothetical protein
MKKLLVSPFLFALAGDDPEAAQAQRERLYKLHLGRAGLRGEITGGSWQPGRSHKGRVKKKAA